MKLKILFEDGNVIAVEKPSRVEVYNLIKIFLERFPNLKSVGVAPRYGLIHRLDKETSGIILIAKNNKALKFFQRQFKEKEVLKKYLALVVGEIKSRKGEIETLIGRSEKDRKKQKAFLPLSPKAKRKGKRWAKTFLKVKKRLKDFTLLEVTPETGRHHQIRAHLAFIHHPVAGDKLYGFKNQPCPENLKRLFLHATYLKLKNPEGKFIEIKSNLTKDLKEVLKSLK